MPRWTAVMILIALGIMGVYLAITNPIVTLRSGRPLNKWQGRLFYAGYSLLCLAAGVAIWLSR